MVQFFGKKGLLAKISGLRVKSGDDVGETAGDTPLGVMTVDMITPADKPVSINRAVQIYKKYMLGIGYLEKADVSDYVRSLKEDMAEREDELRYEVNNAKEQVMEARSEVKRLQKQLKKCKDDDDREYVQEELDTGAVELKKETAVYEKLVAELTLYKKDKRQFLLNYINSELHGDEWREKDISLQK